jgi:phytoene dehydrogenase-like protein
MCVGGSHRLASALQKVILENGGKLRGSQRIKKIIVDKGVAKGVELEGGVVIEAEKAVISTIDLDTTFIKYVGEANLEKGFVDAIKGWQWEKWSLLQIHLALHEPPNFKAAAANPDINKALIQMIGYEGTGDVIKHWEMIKKGERPTNGFLCSFPSIHDPIQAPAGKCSGLISQMAPYRIKEGPEMWEDFRFKQELINERVDILQKYAPNMTRDKVIWGYAITPMGTARRFLDMVEGSYKQGAYTNLQMGYLRPNYECSGHRTPIKNLYLGGSNTYPGGMVTFGPGYLAADAVVEDTGMKKWWPECESVTNAKAKGFL